MTDSHEVYHLSETLPSDWKYVAEGGSTLVLSFDGEPTSKFAEKVLRVRKSDIHTVFEESAQFWSEPDDPIIQFQAEVVEGLLPYDCLPHFHVAAIDRPWLEALSALVEPRRPESRRKKDRIDLTRHKAVLATDLIGGHGWAVEIKPKWGFLPNPAYLSDTTRPIKTKTCRFCMHAHHRTVTKGEKPPLGYCPLDLYSGDEARVSRAIHGLWDGWIHSEGHANNLRVFVEGQLIDPTKELSLARLSSEILSDTSSDVAPDVDLRARFSELVGRLVLASPVLRTLARLQRTLDALDVEGLHELLRRAGAPFSKELIASDQPDSLFVEPTIEEWIDFVRAYNTHFSNPETALSQDAPEPDADNPTVVRYHLLAYLLSMSFKDCSIILNLHPDNPAADRVSVIDLDPKTVRKIGLWEGLDQTIVKTYSQLPQEKRKICVDAATVQTPRPAERILETSDDEWERVEGDEQGKEDADTMRFLVVLTVIVGVFSFIVIPARS